MVTVINPQPHVSVVKEAICRHCGATLQYVPVDVQERTVCDYDGSHDIHRFIRCPKCLSEVGVR